MGVDFLAVGAHPDDCEIFMGGTLIRLGRMGYRVVVCDLTRGEAGTYGSGETRQAEIERSNGVLGLDGRITLDLGDGRLEDNEANRLALIQVIREFSPRIVFTFDERFTRHPDHLACSRICKKSAFLSGLEKFNAPGKAHRPKAVLRFPELILAQKPDFVIDVTEFWAERIEAVRCFQSQVTVPGERVQTKTLLRSHHFWELLRSRSVQAGGWGGCELAEPFYAEYSPVLADPLMSFDRSFV